MEKKNDLIGAYPAFTGWLPPIPDVRDYSIEHEKVISASELLKLKKEKLLKLKDATEDAQIESLGFPALPSSIDLRANCSPIEDQGNLGSCTAQAGVGIVEYLENKAFGHHINGSRLFVYKNARNLLGWTGDTGAFIKTTMASLALLGCPHERYWPYNIADFDLDPPNFVYGIADNYEATKYFCHDPFHLMVNPTKTLFSVKLYLAAKIPSMFGFYGFENGHWEGRQYFMPYYKGLVYFPCPGQSMKWGHAVVAVGYDDNKIIKNPDCDVKTKGALLIRNSWGIDWGEKGYGWLPYEFVLKKYAIDFWSLISMRWVETGEFGLD